MISARTGAVIIVFVLIGGLACIGIALAAWLGPMSAHGTNVMHADGKVIEVGPGKNFVLETATDEKMKFVCGTDCRASVRHLVRHVKEGAHTDVYYVWGVHHELQVVDVD